MPLLKNRIVLFACVTILAAACGCKQGPWDSLTPQYSQKDAPHLDAVRSITPNLISIAASPDGSLWAVGFDDPILKSEDQGRSLAKFQITAANSHYRSLSSPTGITCDNAIYRH